MKAIITITAILISLTAMSQPFLGLQVNNKGGTVQLGALIETVEITASYKTPFSREDVAKVASLSIGKVVFLTKNDEDNYSISLHAGYANYRIKDFAAYDADGTGKTGITQINEYRPVFGVEAGKDIYLGRVFISANYCKGMWYGVGIKMFPYRN